MKRNIRVCVWPNTKETWTKCEDSHELPHVSNTNPTITPIVTVHPHVVPAMTLQTAKTLTRTACLHGA